MQPTAIFFCSVGLKILHEQNIRFKGSGSGYSKIEDFHEDYFDRTTEITRTLITTSKPFSENFQQLTTIPGPGLRFRKLEMVDFCDY